MNEQRRYVRMNTVFPVELRVLSGGVGKDPSGVLQGFTRDVSEGGLCIELKVFNPDQEDVLGVSGTFLDLTINPLFTLHPIKATASVVWVRKETSAHLAKYWIGVNYHSIDAVSRQRLIRHAQRSVWAPRLTGVGAVLLLILLTGLGIHDQKLTLQNKHLVTQLRVAAEKRSRVALELRGVDQRKKSLSVKLSAAHGALSDIQQRKIQLELDDLNAGQKNLQETYRHLEEAARTDSGAVSEQMFQWIRSHQNLKTGLVASFEGDPALEDAAFTYDQSLAAQVFLLFGDKESAARILLFYEKRAERQDSVFYNSYDTTSGGVSERTVQTGPNAWLGIAALQYEFRVKDGRFLPMARQIGDWLVTLQDAEGGIRGGPKFTWYSTEHNLDAYAFFGLLKVATHDQKYAQAQSRLLEWMKKYSYSIHENRLNRGKGDSTIATDTFGWAVAAVGPATLKKIQFDPEGILDFAEKNCSVTVDFQRTGDKPMRTHGFDFAKALHLGRGGVLSTEWTAQMIVGYEVMTRYFDSMHDTEKAALYRHKADFYLNELQKMVITSPSRTGQGRGCLPYASMDNVDTGHGWHTPKGTTTGSVSGTAYGLFAWKNYNPFEVNDRA